MKRNKKLMKKLKNKNNYYMIKKYNKKMINLNYKKYIKNY